MNKKNAIVVTDFRLEILFSYLQIYNSTSNSILIIPETAINEMEYGNYSYKWYKKLKLKLLKILGYEIEIVGYEKKYNIEMAGVMSSLVSQTRNINASKKDYPDLYNKYIKNSECAYAICEKLESDEYKSVYIYNGRFSSTYPITINEKIKNKLFYIEIGVIPHKFSIYNFNIFDFTSLFEAVNYDIKGKYNKIKAEYGSRRRDEYLKRKSNNIFSVKNTEIMKESYDLCFFTNTPHEMAAVEKYIKENDLQYINKILKENKYKKTVIRMHPNFSQDKSWKKFEKEYEKALGELTELKIINPSENINSIELARNCKFVAVNHSSIAAECVLLGMDVIVSKESLIGKIIDEIEKKYDIKSIEGKKLFVEYMCSVEEFGQISYHPKWIVLLKLFKRIDMKLGEYIEVESAPTAG